MVDEETLLHRKQAYQDELKRLQRVVKQGSTDSLLPLHDEKPHLPIFSKANSSKLSATLDMDKSVPSSSIISKLSCLNISTCLDLDDQTSIFSWPSTVIHYPTTNLIRHCRPFTGPFQSIESELTVRPGLCDSPLYNGMHVGPGNECNLSSSLRGNRLKKFTDFTVESLLNK